MGFGDMIDYQVSNHNLNAGVFARFRIADWFGISMSFDYTGFSGVLPVGNPGDVPEEIYSFENTVMEFGGKVEFFVPMNYGSPVDIYGFTGLSVFYNNPRIFGVTGNELVIVQSVNVLQPALPIGFGVNFRVVPRFKLGYEMGYRYLVYNFLDGIIVSGSNFDSYLYNQVKVSYSLRPASH